MSNPRYARKKYYTIGKVPAEFREQAKQIVRQSQAKIIPQPPSNFAAGPLYFSRDWQLADAN
ncbi:MAG: hypothetical protein OEV26_04565 [Gallionella sp.]|nr:hypothetical protein [Gallionella sp.]MDH4286678.1 hypothetical protein [Gallionella sp.]